jgi:hypothetical protein
MNTLITAFAALSFVCAFVWHDQPVRNREEESPAEPPATPENERIA